MNLGLLALLLLLIGLFYWLRSRSGQGQNSRRATKAGQPSRSNQWHAVKLLPGEHCCESIQLMTDKAYLAAQAPPLPLPDCSLPSCACRYQHFNDRRQEIRRDPFSQHGRITASVLSEERRQGRGRRATDAQPA